MNGVSAGRRMIGMVFVAVLALGTLGATGDGVLEGPVSSADDPPLPEPAFTDLIEGGECTAENPYEARLYGVEVGEPIYDEGCERLRFAFGPLVVKPGENDALIEPVTIEQPRYDGYLTRFKPDLLLAATGEPPQTDHMHLHHATWLALRGDYGSGPLFASGEEKTILTMPPGYGMKIGANDLWGLLYMIHSEIADPQVVWLTYEIDFIDEETAEQAHDIAQVYQIWLDVMGNPMPHPDMPNRGGNPIFNVHKGFGDIDEETGRRTCTWPKQNCARFDYYHEVNPHQGDPGPDEDPDKYDIRGTDWTVPARLEGTLVTLGGHLHPGGLRVEVDQVRDGVEKKIAISDAFYWDWDDPERVGGKPHSWNLSMGKLSAEHGWKVKIKEGDKLRINGVYDSQDGSWYGQMGIAMTWVAPDDPHGPEGVDVFDEDVELDRGVPAQALLPDGPYDPATGWRPDRCEPDLTGESGQRRLCLRTQPTHGQVPESGHHGQEGDCTRDPGTCPALPDTEGSLVTDIVAAGFTYGQADQGVIGQNGIPRVAKGETVRMWNLDSPARIWHTFTRCKEPCSGPSNMHYPISNGGSGDPWDQMDFDSGELGYGTTLDQTKSQPIVNSGDKSTEEHVRDGIVWEWTPAETGVYTFWCRIHRGMRGAVEVVDPEG